MKRILMASLVEELEQDAYDRKASLSNMLRKAKAIAVKLQLRQPAAWVEAELNGYGRADVPSYRKLLGRARVRNPFHGWQPLMFGDSEIERMICNFDIRQSIAEIEHLLETQGEPSIALDGAVVEKMSRMFDLPELPISVFFPMNSFVAICDAVRNRILDWSLQLQADGITGEGMTFRPEEKARVSGRGDTYNIGSISGFAGNLGGQVAGDVSGNSVSNVGQELEKISTLIEQIRQHFGQLALPSHKDAELRNAVDALDEELRGGRPSATVVRRLLQSIKVIAEGAMGNLIASGIVGAISRIHL